MADNRTEKPTPKRRKEARDKGQIARSTDLTSAAVLLGGILAIVVTAPTMLDRFSEIVRVGLSQSGDSHLAGRAGVELLDAMLRRRFLNQEPSGRTGWAGTPAARFEVTGAGAKALSSFGVDAGEVRRSRRHFAGACIDWTQRRGHLNGALAAAITSRLFELGWIERGQGKTARRRSVLVTPAGLEGLACTFGVDLP